METLNTLVSALSVIGATALLALVILAVAAGIAFLIRFFSTFQEKPIEYGRAMSWSSGLLLFGFLVFTVGRLFLALPPSG